MRLDLSEPASESSTDWMGRLDNNKCWDAYGPPVILISVATKIRRSRESQPIIMSSAIAGESITRAPDADMVLETS